MMIMALIFRNIGRKKGMELILTGDRITAREAEAIGLVNRTVPIEELDDAFSTWHAGLQGIGVRRLGTMHSSTSKTCHLARRSSICRVSDVEYVD